MENKERTHFELSIDTIKEIPIDRYRKDFTFIVNGEEYKTSRLYADFLSPLIRRYHMIDESICSFNINTSETYHGVDFSIVLSLETFSPIELNSEQMNFLREIFYRLGNKKEYLKLLPKETVELTLDNVFEQIKIKQKCYKNIENDGNIDIDFLKQEIEFISGHFFEIDKNQVKKLEVDIINEIIKNDNLQIEDEDSLLDFIICVYNESDHKTSLFDQVYFINVGKEKLKEFYEIFDLNDINQKIWESMIERTQNSEINQEKQTETNNRRKYMKPKGQLFKYVKGEEFNGIIKYLTDKTGGNIHDNGTIEATCNIPNNSSPPKNLLDFNETTFYCGNSGKYDVWICFDFKEMKVNISNYSIRTINSSRSTHHLKSWVIEISDDKNKWTPIDEHTDCQTLNGFNITGTFNVQNNEFTRYVRLRQTSVPWGGNNVWFHYIEFFGYLQE